MYSHVYRMSVIKLGFTSLSHPPTAVGIYAGKDEDQAKAVGLSCMSINWGVTVKDLRDPEKYLVIWETLKEPE